MSVAMVMPEIGFDEEPMMPTMRLATVTKKKPKTTTRSAIRIFWKTEFPGTCGSAASSTTRPRLPAMTVTKERSRSVREMDAAATLSPMERMPSRSEDQMVGKVLVSVMKPPAATAPAPIWRMYA